MYLSTAEQNDAASLIVKWVQENTTGYGAIVTEVDRPSHCAAAAVAIFRNGSTACTARVAVHHNRITYVSRLSTHISYPIAPENVGRIVGGFLSLEEN